MNPKDVSSGVKTLNRRGAVLAGTALLAVALAATALSAPATQRGRDKDKKAVMEVSKADKSYLGVNMQEIDADVLKGLDAKVTQGVLISQVVEGSPAEEAGMKDGDIVVEFDRKDVASPDELRDLVEKTRVGDTVKVKVVRGGEPKTLSVTIGQWPGDDKWSAGGPEEFHWQGDPAMFHSIFLGRGRLGVQVTELNEGLAPYFGVKEGEGVLVLDVNDESTAKEMGIKAGDVIVKVKGEPVGSVDDLTDAVGKLKSGEKFDVSLVRERKDLALEGEAAESLGDAYKKMLLVKPDSHMRKLEMHGIPELEMNEVKKEMKKLQKELEDLKDELKKLQETR